MALDFPSAQLPQLLPLEGSFAENEIEADLKRLFLDLFGANLATDSFDANVLGAAHLGSLDLVRKSVNTDGLVLMQGDREEAATRYLYRAWKSGDVQGRGLHFLRTYLQMLFPNSCEVEQLWHEKAAQYPTALRTLEEVTEGGLESDVFLTSRIDIAIDFAANPLAFESLMSIVGATIPARLIPVFSKVIARFFTSIKRAVFTISGEVSTVYPYVERLMTCSATSSRRGIGVHEINIVEVLPA